MPLNNSRHRESREPRAHTRQGPAKGGAICSCTVDRHKAASPTWVSTNGHDISCYGNGHPSECARSQPFAPKTSASSGQLAGPSSNGQTPFSCRGAALSTSSAKLPHPSTSSHPSGLENPFAPSHSFKMTFLKLLW